MRSRIGRVVARHSPAGDSCIGRAEVHARNIIKWAFDYRGERGPISRRYQFAVLRRITKTLLVQKDGIVYFVDGRDNVIGRATYSYGSFEKEYMDLAISLVREYCGDVITDKVIVDVGANIGTFTVPALIRYGARKVVAFEPSPNNAFYLRVNVAANDLNDRVDIREIALSNEEGSFDLELSPDNWGDHRIRMSNAGGRFGEDRRETISVPVATLATSDLDNDLGLIWMDTQGHEGHVLAGGADNLQVPVVTEYWPYALERAGGSALMHDVIASRFESIIDIRATASRNSPVVFPAKSIGLLYESLSPSGSTDLVLVPFK